MESEASLRTILLTDGTSRYSPGVQAQEGLGPLTTIRTYQQGKLERLMMCWQLRLQKLSYQV